MGLLLVVVLPAPGLNTPKVHLQGSACKDSPCCVQFVFPAITAMSCVHAFFLLALLKLGTCCT
jgi:hypothetical protein